jgi:membrane fusion protein, macrolide-specific efflux system
MECHPVFKLIALLFLTACQTQTIHPEKGNIIEAVYGLGIIKSEKNFNARAAIVSSIKEFYVTEGQDVAQGQKLFLTDQGSVISAPFTGRVTERPIAVAETLFPQTVILKMVDLTDLYLEVSLEQQGAMKLAKGMEAEISFEFFRNQKIKGTLATIYPKNDQFVAKVLAKEWPAGILPGMSADVAFKVASKENVILIPLKAVANGSIVIKRDGEKKQKIPVKLGFMDQEKAELLEPVLSPSDEIIMP